MAKNPERLVRDQAQRMTEYVRRLDRLNEQQSALADGVTPAAILAVAVDYDKPIWRKPGAPMHPRFRRPSRALYLRSSAGACPMLDFWFSALLPAHGSARRFYTSAVFTASGCWMKRHSGNASLLWSDDTSGANQLGRCSSSICTESGSPLARCE